MSPHLTEAFTRLAIAIEVIAHLYQLLETAKAPEEVLVAAAEWRQAGDALRDAIRREVLRRREKP
jgi:hypothetical protein